MNTLKNAALLIVMGGVLYFVYITLNKPPASPGASHVELQHESLAPPDIDFQPPDMVPDNGFSSGPVIDTSTEQADDSIVEQAAPRGRRRPNPRSDYESRPLPHDSLAGGSQFPPMVPVKPAPPPNVEAADPGSSYAVVENAPSERRNSAWNSSASQEPPVAPEFPDYPSPPTDYLPNVPNTEVAEAPSMPAFPADEIPPAAGEMIRDPNVIMTSTADPVPSGSSYGSSKLDAHVIKSTFAEGSRAAESGQFREALAILTTLYKRNDLGPTDRRVLLQWLDPLAAKVIYSHEHTLADAYRVRRGEDLLSISEQLNVPWQLLQNINNIRDPQVVVPNTMLKVIPGPFSAEVDLNSHELTLYLQDMYAGRFAFLVGNDAPRPGLYKVLDKSRDHAYYGHDGRVIGGKDPANPYGGWWIDLGSGISLHGSATAANATERTLGCISFSPQDAQDIFSILSHQSTVTIR